MAKQKRVHITLPTSWNDLTPRQLKKITWAMFTNANPKFLDVIVFFILLDIRWWQFKKHVNFLRTINQVGISTLKQHYSWLYDSLDLQRFIPFIKIGFKKYYAPADRITNLTVDEFAHAEDLFIGWNNTHDLEYLQYLTSVLYSKKTPEGSRYPFDKNLLEVKANKFKKVNTKTLLAVMLSYKGSRYYLEQRYKKVFPKNSQSKVNTVKAKITSSGFGKLILAFSGGKFGTHNETKSTNVYVFLDEYEEQLNKPKPTKNAKSNI